MASPRRRVALAAQLLLAAIVLVFAGREIARQWADVRNRSLEVDPQWGAIVLSALVVLCAYAILIHSWRRVLGAWGPSLRFRVAARIWFVSNLGRYVPGKIWQIGALSIMAQRRGISPAAAVSGALLVNLINVVTGFAVVAVTGIHVFEGVPRAGFAALLLLGISIAALPVLVPYGASLAGRLLARDIALPAIPPSAIWVSAVGTTAAWLLYGLAFWMLASGLLPRSPGALGEYVAVFVGSYLVGYLTLFSPGGIVVREVAMMAAITRLGLANAAEAAMLAVASRLWLTVLEVLPGALFLIRPDSATGEQRR